MRNFNALIVATALAALGSPALAQQQSSPDGTNANGPITIFKNMAPEPGGITVRIDGREIDHLRQAAYDDVTTTVKPGSNTLTVTWNHPIQRLDFEVAFAPTRNAYRRVLSVNVESAKDHSLNEPGSKTLTFTIPSN
jgi:hypothetical protein